MRGTPLNNKIVRLIKEPLVHFFVFIGTIFVFYGFFGKQNAEEQERVITNSAGEIGWLIPGKSAGTDRRPLNCYEKTDLEFNRKETNV